MPKSKSSISFVLCLGFLVLVSGLGTAAQRGGRDQNLVLLDFEELRVEDVDCCHRFMAPAIYIKDGVVIEATTPDPLTNIPRLYWPGTLSPIFPGSTAMRSGNSTSELIVTRVNNGEFDLIGIDLVEVPNLDSGGVLINGGIFPVTFVGVKHNGKLVVQTFMVGEDFFNLEEFKFRRFSRLIRVHWFQDAGLEPGHQFDNIRLRLR